MVDNYKNCNPKYFEVGKFYMIPVMSGFSTKKIPSRCSRVMKYRVEFEHFYRDFDNVRHIVTDRYRLYRGPMGDTAGSTDKWSSLGRGYASDEIPKPEWRDEREAEAKLNDNKRNNQK